MRKHLGFSLLLIALVMGMLMSSQLATPQPVETNQTNTIGGLTYEHGWVNFKDSGNFTTEQSGFIQEVNREVVITNNVQIPLITNITYNDTFYMVDMYRYDAVEDQFEVYNTVPMNNRFLNASLYWLLGLNATLGSSMNLNITEDFDVTMVAVIDRTTESYLGQYPANVSLFEYFNATNGDYTAWVITPKAILVDVTYILEFVNVNQTAVSVGVFGYYARYSMEYNVSGWAYRVAVTDGENFGFQALMWDNVTASYIEYGALWMGYYLAHYELTQLTFASNDSEVPWEMYPRTLLPVVYEGQGEMFSLGVNYANLTAITTLQSLVAAFLTTSSNETIAQAKLAIWATNKATTLLAYSDGNNNSMLDITMTEEGFRPGGGDFVSYVGFGEAYNLDLMQYYTESINATQSLIIYGTNLNFTEQLNETNEYFRYESIQFGDVNAARSTTPIWEDPVQDENGTVYFTFGMNYTDFPMTWVDTTTGEWTSDQEFISYKYVLAVDPSTGRADISPTFTFGGVQDAQLKSEMAGLSVAMPILLEFFAAEAVKTKTQVDAPVNSTRTTRSAAFAMTNGLGDSFIEIEMPDDKKNYTVAGDTYEARLSALNLVTIAGVAQEETTTPITSETGDVGGTATVNAVKETTTISFIYSANLLLVSYPVWGGNQIRHDPTYKVDYEPQQTPTDTTSTTTTEETPKENTTTSEAPAPEPTPAESSGLPGFEYLSAILGVGFVTLAILIRKKK